jgi:hypothetical protein
MRRKVSVTIFGSGFSEEQEYDNQLIKRLIKEGYDVDVISIDNKEELKSDNYFKIKKSNEDKYEYKTILADNARSYCMDVKIDDKQGKVTVFRWQKDMKELNLLPNPPTGYDAFINIWATANNKFCECCYSNLTNTLFNDHSTTIAWATCSIPMQIMKDKDAEVESLPLQGYCPNELKNPSPEQMKEIYKHQVDNIRLNPISKETVAQVVEALKSKTQKLQEEEIKSIKGALKDAIGDDRFKNDNLYLGRFGLLSDLHFDTSNNDTKLTIVPSCCSDNRFGEFAQKINTSLQKKGFELKQEGDSYKFEKI